MYNVIEHACIHLSRYDSPDNFSGVAIGTGGGQPLNGALPSLPSPTMPGFSMGAQTPNGQPPPQDAVYTNGIHQTFTGPVPVTAQGLPNGEAAALQHAAYSGMQPFPGVGESRAPHPAPPPHPGSSRRNA
ncbi:hypothetical protein EVAR_54692_1 [Eumeta japonica]|uniref:Uncharacterized protein n=1 Tax=Eumeta variegata TaxID=151549 RepID=A0A4C1X9J2_EUMVA|nr:hypothetical protein EVAR_54692_1 [Eumeta japonica]